MNTKSKNAKRHNKNKSTCSHPVQQTIKLVFAGFFAVFIAVIYWFGRGFFSEEVNLNLYGYSDGGAAFLEGLYRLTPIIILCIYVVELVLVVVMLKRNTDKCTTICRIVCIVLAIVAMLFNVFTDFVSGIFSKIVGNIISFDEGSEFWGLIFSFVPGILGWLMVQITVLAFPVMTFGQDGWINVATWLLFFIPGAGTAIAIVLLAIALFSNIGSGGGDNDDSYDIIILKH